MPTFQITQNVEVNLDVDFEVFCSCGEGLCGETTTRTSRNRLHPQAVVNPCPECMGKLRERIEELEALLDENSNQ